MFADDLIIFCKVDPKSIQQIKDTFAVFSETAGFKANMQKSQLVLGGRSFELQGKCLKIANLQEAQFPLKYLGVPITTSQLTKLKCRALVEKIVSRSIHRPLEISLSQRRLN